MAWHTLSAEKNNFCINMNSSLQLCGFMILENCLISSINFPIQKMKMMTNSTSIVESMNMCMPNKLNNIEINLA